MIFLAEVQLNLNVIADCWILFTSVWKWYKDFFLLLFNRSGQACVTTHLRLAMFSLQCKHEMYANRCKMNLKLNDLHEPNWVACIELVVILFPFSFVYLLSGCEAIHRFFIRFKLNSCNTLNMCCLSYLRYFSFARANSPGNFTC